MAKTISADFPTVKIGATTYTLTPTLAAVRRVNVALGGLLPAFRRCNDLDIDAIAAVIAAGAGLDFEDQDEADKFAERVWKADRDAYIKGLVAFLSLLLAGGRKPDEKKPDEAAEEKTEGNA